MPTTQTRRRFLTTLSAVGAAGVLRGPRALAAEAALETTSVRLPKFLSVCVSPQHAAEELLRAEGFTDIRYVDTPASAVAEAIAHDRLDIGLNYAALFLPAIDGSQPITVLAGVHVGCFELFAKEGIRNAADLKGRTVGLQDWGSTAHVLVALMAAHVGLDPAKDIRWVTDPSVKQLVDSGFTDRYAYALQTLSELPYDKWREYDPEDTMRFYALRLHEAGMIKASPQKIIAEGTDWRFLNELKRELKA